MAKIKIEFTLEKLSLKVEAEREHVPAITQSLKQQFAGLLQAPASAVGIESVEAQPHRAPALEVGEAESKQRGSKKGKRSAGSREESVAIDFKHDGTRWGMPKQEWSTAQKAMWLLHVIEKQTGHKDLSTGAIVATFNKHFRQAKAIYNANVHRDLGKAKMAVPALVGEDTAKNPSRWYLIDAGTKEVEKLIGGAATTVIA